MEHIYNVKMVEVNQVTIRLNADGTSKIEYNIGDEVAFYLPPRDDAVKAMGKKKKHILQYVGPGVIVNITPPSVSSTRIDITKGTSYTGYQQNSLSGGHVRSSIRGRGYKTA